ncbi:MAG: beta-glucosidase [Bacteroidetes bacterium]|nr:beta-glucosidase [Bacteroidota bacterium]
MLYSSDFGDNFHWGVSTAAYQIEGGYNVDGKGSSIWDVFANTRGKIAGNANGNVACDFYNRYKEDIQLLSYLNIPNFRFSISWSRIFPNGTGFINQNGLDFYDRLIDQLLENGITPWITLYHWDLPAALEKKGGWTNRDVIGWFSEYVDLCARKFGDRVINWMVLNEPMVFTGAGYFLGIHAPGRKGLKNFIPAIHHASLCQAQGGRILKSYNSDFNVGTTFSCSLVEPLTNTEKDRLAVIKVDALLNRLFLEPAIGMGYPIKDLKLLERIYNYFKPSDEHLLMFDFDFIGIQNYTREIVSHSYFVPLINSKIIKANKRNVPYTTMNWEVYPASIYHMIKKYDAYDQVRKIVITENGAAFHDTIIDGTIEDTKRQQFISEYIKEVYNAKKEGAKVDGYFVWTFTDNFEWAEGYNPRFGLVHVDFATQKRTIKKSGMWYKAFLNNLQL